jgi:hypothetical protein
MIKLFDISKTRLGRFQLHLPCQSLNFFSFGCSWMRVAGDLRLELIVS